jgi:hypothetical protein
MQTCVKKKKRMEECLCLTSLSRVHWPQKISSHHKTLISLYSCDWVAVRLCGTMANNGPIVLSTDNW